MSIILYGSLCASMDKDTYMKKVQESKALTFKVLLKDYVTYLGGMQNNMPNLAIESEFYSSNCDSDYVAIDFKTITKEKVNFLQNDAVFVLYNKNSYRYGLLFDENANLVDAILLSNSAGNNEWSMDRKAEVALNPKPSIIVTDRYFNTEWIVEFEKGANILSNEKKYIVTISKDAKFSVKLSSAKKLYMLEDKKLNQFYKKDMKLLAKSEKKDLLDTQRAWLKYIDKKCNIFITNVTQQDASSLHVKSHRENCLYQETKLRATELQNIYEELNFYK